MEENKKKMLSLGIAILVLLFIVVGATYAYFAAQIDSGSSTDVNITAESVDSLTFTTGEALSFSLTQDNMQQGGTNVEGSTTATASLIAGKDSSASYNYNVYVNISKNTFRYTTEEETAEIIMQVTKPDGTTLTSVEGLNYVTEGGVSGFDVTVKDGLVDRKSVV